MRQVYGGARRGAGLALVEVRADHAGKAEELARRRVEHVQEVARRPIRVRRRRAGFDRRLHAVVPTGVTRQLQPRSISSAGVRPPDCAIVVTPPAAAPEPFSPPAATGLGPTRAFAPIDGSRPHAEPMSAHAHSAPAIPSRPTVAKLVYPYRPPDFIYSGGNGGAKVKRHLGLTTFTSNRRNPPLESRHVTLPRVKRAGDVTGLLQAWMRGDPDALAELASLVHYELRQMAKRMLAGERAAYAWQPTDLINESHLRLLGWRDVEWKNRAHFFAATAKMMRRVLVDAARARQATKRGAGEAPIPIDGLDVAAPDAVSMSSRSRARSLSSRHSTRDPRKWSKCVSSVDSASKRRLTRSVSPRAP